jgi:hypothetical protein
MVNGAPFAKLFTILVVGPSTNSTVLFTNNALPSLGVLFTKNNVSEELSPHIWIAPPLPFDKLNWVNETLAFVPLNSWVSPLYQKNL